MKPLYIGKALTMAVLACSALQSQGAPISTLFTTNYGDRVGTTVTYHDINESSITDAQALYGAPSISGNTLNMTPEGFGAFSGEPEETDHTDGNLSFTLSADTGGLTELQFSELGDYSLFSTGDKYAYVSIAAFFNIRITKVDGQVVDPQIPGQAEMTYTPSDEILHQSPFPKTENGLWDGYISIDLEEILDNAVIPYDIGVTEVIVSLDNSLTAYSEDGATAFIQKKDFTGFSITAIPEPASMGLLMVTSGLVVFVRRIFIV